jgi:uncharacterized membrane protein YbhN (UPF0104 family)
VKTKQLLSIAGILLTLAAILFIGRLLWRYGETILTAPLDASHLALFIAGSLVYSITGALLAVSWFRLLHLFGKPGIPFPHSFKIYARSQMAKYIPGNVFQFAARHVSGRTHGIGHGPLMASMMYEIVGIAWAAGVLGLTGFLLYRLRQPHLSLPLIALVCVGLFLFPAIFNKAAHRIKFLEPMAIRETSSIAIFRRIAPIYLLYILFFIINGCVFVLAVNATSGSRLLDNGSLVLSIYAVSWLAGFLTPGAPGGIGVRETVMVLLLTPIVTQPAALLAALFFRLINIFGDILLFLLSLPVAGKRIEGTGD